MIPIALLLLGIFLTTFKYIKNPAIVSLNSHLYPYEFKINDFTLNKTNYTDIITKNMEGDPEIKIINSEDPKKFDLELFN